MSPLKSEKLQIVFFVGVIFGLAFICYWPGIFGEILWDDLGHITRPELSSIRGLLRIWSDPRATQQYYPVLHSAFWIERHLWSDSLFGYHCVNIILHALSGCLLAIAVKRIGSIGLASQTQYPPFWGWIASCLFVIHPVGVESVAWITEQKNTLSLVFYLASAIIYVGFIQTRSLRSYIIATIVFILALGTKTVTATLPAALLVVLWWRQGTITPRRDLAPLAPWLAIALISGATTAWLENHFIGAHGEAFALSLVDRTFLAARVIWHYAAKVVWPVDLLFFYPRWDAIHHSLSDGLPILGAISLTIILWIFRSRDRGPLTACLLFVGGLFPALGFIDVFPFQFSYVADHFQYLANLPLFVIIAYGIAQSLVSHRALTVSVAAVGLIVLVGLSRKQAALYISNEALFRATLAGNPESWMAHDIIGAAIRKYPGRSEEAVTEFRSAIQLRPNDPDAHFGLGIELAKSPATKSQAIAEYTEAIQLRPNYIEAYNALAIELAATGQPEQAIANYTRALTLNPDFVEANINLADLLASRPDRFPEAISHYEAALNARPSYAIAHANLANVLLRSGKINEGIAHYRAALRIDPTLAWVHRNLAMAIAQNPADLDEAIKECMESLRIRPDDAEGHNAFAILYAQKHLYSQARQEWENALRLNPRHEAARRNLRQLETIPFSKD